MKKRRDTPDPNAAREAERYTHPIASREAILTLLASLEAPTDLTGLAERLGLTHERDLDALTRRLAAMERDGQLVRERRGRFGLPARMDMITGRVIGHPDGFGFLTPETGGDDLFIPPREMRKVWHGDRAMAHVTGVDPRGRQEAGIVEVIERARTSVVGRYREERGIGYVLPSDKRIPNEVLIPTEARGIAKPDQIVVVEIESFATSRQPPVGRVTEVLGHHLEAGMEVEVAIRTHGLPHAFPPGVMDEAGRIAPTVPATAAAGRYELRTLPLVTIDGDDARDFDDAVYAERDGGGFRLIVAIADVANYVTPGTALDTEARSRGTSVYFPQYVIPMLPETLSNGLCSLNPDVDRLCLACEMKISAAGLVSGYRFHNAILRSQARLTYTQAATMLVERDTGLRGRYSAPVLESLDTLYAVFKALHKARLRRGAVDFDLPETRIVYEGRKIVRIEPTQRNDAHRLIEECMLAANVCAADFLAARKVGLLYRVHAAPPAEKLDMLRTFLSGLGLDLTGGATPGPKDYSRLLEQAGKRPDARLIHTVMLRSLSQAQYTPENIGHFALGYKYYAHFTSPIRRYPDLQVHRAIKTCLDHTGVRKPGAGPDAALHALGEHCSMTERRADDATREVVRRLKVEYMQDHVGEVFPGIVSGVTSFGMFVELSDFFVDGLVHISTLGNDYYHYEPARQRLIGERTNQVICLGDKVSVRIVRADVDEARLDFELVTDAGSGQQKRGKSSGRSVGKSPARHGGSGRAPRGGTGRRRGR